MKRVIVDYSKLNDHILELLTSTYPDGYSDDDIISFYNSKKERIECVEIKTEDTIYLVKIGKKLVAAMDEYQSDQDDEDTDDDFDADFDSDTISEDLEEEDDD